MSAPERIHQGYVVRNAYEHGIESGYNIVSVPHSTPNPGVAAGDLILIVYTCYETFWNVIFTPPSGFTEQGRLENYNSGYGWYCFYRVADGSEGASFDASFDMGTGFNDLNAAYTAQIFVYRGVDSSDPFDGGQVQLTASFDGNIAILDATSSGADRTSLAMFSIWKDATGVAAPSGYTLLHDHLYVEKDSGAERIRFAAADKTVGAGTIDPGSFGSVVYDSSFGYDTYLSTHIILKPGAAVPTILSDESAHTQVASAPSLTGIYPVAPGSGAHVQTADTPALTSIPPTFDLAPVDAVHLHLLDGTTLSQRIRAIVVEAYMTLPTDQTIPDLFPFSAWHLHEMNVPSLQAIAPPTFTIAPESAVQVFAADSLVVTFNAALGVDLVSESAIAAAGVSQTQSLAGAVVSSISLARPRPVNSAAAYLPDPTHVLEASVTIETTRKRFPTGRATSKRQVSTPTRALRLEWDGLSSAEFGELRAFFEARSGGYEPFIVTDPHTGDSYTVRFDGDEIRRRPSRRNIIGLYRIQIEVSTI